MDARRNPLIVEHLAPPDAPFYVYLLIDPRDGRPFYVGKGTGDRFRAHGLEALMGADAESEQESGDKVARIRAIRAAGLEPRIEFARTGIRTEAEAFLVEAALIDSLARHVAPLTNVVRGHDTGTGLVTLEELEMRLAAPPLETNMSAVLIKLGPWKVLPDALPRPGHGFRPGMTESELYDSTRAWWVISRDRAMNTQWFVSVYAGITRGVWEFDHATWSSRLSPLPNGKVQQRWAFEGRSAPDHVRAAFIGDLGKRIPPRDDGRPVFGSGSVIAYWPS